ncbi:hypothetical protein N9Y17_01350 [Gammaproteobacteria bacterium]|nr:hypothetical protein [Gammaproteobacteria bacterium]
MKQYSSLSSTRSLKPSQSMWVQRHRYISAMIYFGMIDQFKEPFQLAFNQPMADWDQSTYRSVTLNYQKLYLLVDRMVGLEQAAITNHGQAYLRQLYSPVDSHHLHSDQSSKRVNRVSQLIHQLLGHWQLKQPDHHLYGIKIAQSLLFFRQVTRVDVYNKHEAIILSDEPLTPDQYQRLIQSLQHLQLIFSLLHMEQDPIKQCGDVLGQKNDQYHALIGLIQQIIPSIESYSSLTLKQRQLIQASLVNLQSHVRNHTIIVADIQHQHQKLGRLSFYWQSLMQGLGQQINFIGWRDYVKMGDQIQRQSMALTKDQMVNHSHWVSGMDYLMAALSDHQSVYGLLTDNQQYQSSSQSESSVDQLDIAKHVEMYNNQQYLPLWQKDERNQLIQRRRYQLMSQTGYQSDDEENHFLAKVNNECATKKGIIRQVIQLPSGIQNQILFFLVNDGIPHATWVPKVPRSMLSSRDDGQRYRQVKSFLDEQKQDRVAQTLYHQGQQSIASMQFLHWRWDLAATSFMKFGVCLVMTAIAIHIDYLLPWLSLPMITLGICSVLFLVLGVYNQYLLMSHEFDQSLKTNAISMQGLDHQLANPKFGARLFLSVLMHKKVLIAKVWIKQDEQGKLQFKILRQVQVGQQKVYAKLEEDIANLAS